MPVSASAIPDEYRADVARAVEICRRRDAEMCLYLARSQPDGIGRTPIWI